MSLSKLKEKFAQIHDFDNKDDFEKVIKAIIHLANQPRKNTTNEQIVGYGIYDFFSKIGNHQNRLLKMFYNENEDEMKCFIRSIFDDVATPYRYKADVLRHANQTTESIFPLGKNERIDISEKYLKKHCSEIDKMDMFNWRIFHACKFTDEEGEDMDVSENVKEIMKTFCLQKDLDGFLFRIIELEPVNENCFKISAVILKIFDSWNAFEEVLNELDEKQYNYLKEFKVFYQKFKAVNFSLYVAFDFQDIPIEDKRVK